MDQSIWFWVIFNAAVLGLLALDLGVFHRDSHEVSVKEAGMWSVVWITLSLLFNGAILLFWDRMMPASTYTNSEAALAFLTGYLIEYSLSVDNIFVFVLTMSFFAVPAKYQHRVLFWGIIGALVMRGLMIFVGAALIKEFHWVLWIFGAFLIFTGIRMAFHKEQELHPDDNPLIKAFRRIMPVTAEYRGDKFFVREAGKWMATPLFLVLLMIESTDLVFAVDSIPAIFAVTQDPLLVYTSNVCAILGLRSLYFVLAGVVHKFHYLKLGLAVILSFVGIKMLLPDATNMLIGTAIKVPTALSLGVIVLVLSIAIAASLVRARRIETSGEVASA